jgi:hypothetical protein
MPAGVPWSPVAAERSPAPYVAIALLVALLVTAVGFVVAMWMRPTVTPATALVATDRSAIPCADPKRDTTCFDTQVVNQGSESSGFSCSVIAFGDTSATFADGAPTYELTLGSNEAAHVATIVTAHGKVEAVAPRVQCTPVQA